jgi:hypothetical protein
MKKTLSAVLICLLALTAVFAQGGNETAKKVKFTF